MLIKEAVSRLFRTKTPATRPASPELIEEILQTPLARGNRVTVREVAGLQTEGLRVIDVREPREWAVGHLPDSRNVPLDIIDTSLVPHEAPFILVCRNGYRSGLAARLLVDLGVDEAFIFVLHGGLRSWRAEGRTLQNRDLHTGRLV